MGSNGSKGLFYGICILVTASLIGYLGYTWGRNSREDEINQLNAQVRNYQAINTQLVSTSAVQEERIRVLTNETYRQRKDITTILDDEEKTNTSIQRLIEEGKKRTDKYRVLYGGK